MGYNGGGDGGGGGGLGPGCLGDGVTDSHIRGGHGEEEAEECWEKKQQSIFNNNRCIGIKVLF